MAAPTLTSINSDTGTSGTDLITKDQSLTFTGTADALSFVEIFVNGESIAFGQADGAGTWSIDLASQYGNLAAGSYTIQILSTFGNTSTFSTSYSLTIDLTAPGTPTITGISDDTGASGSDGITTDNTLTLTGTAEANAIVHIFDFGTEIGTAQANGSGAWSYNTGSLAGDQTYSFSASQTDAAGNTGPQSAAVAITVDDTVAAPIITGIVNDTGASGSDGITSDSTITISGTGEAGAVVTVSEGVTVLGTALVNGSGNWSFTPATLSDGDYSFTATQVDVAGNGSGASGAFDVTVDTGVPAAPTIDATITDDNGSSGTDRVTNDNAVTITGDAEADSIVTIRDGATVLGTALADGAGEWSFTTAALADGPHSLTATASDAAGNTSVASSALPVTIDTAAPAAPALTGITTDSGSSNSDEITSDDTPTISGTAEAGSTVEIFRDSVLVGTATADGSGNWSFTDTSLADDTYSYTATATDIAGNTSVASATLSVTIDTDAPAEPVITGFVGNSGDAGDNITNDTDITLSGTAEAGSIVKIFDGNSVLGTALADGSGNWSLATGVLSEGTHEFSATATDAAGNESDETPEFSIEIDTTGPTAAVTSINKPGLGSFDTGSSISDEVTRDRTLILSGTTSEPNATVSVFRDGSLIGTATSDGNGDWSFDYTGTILSDGTYNFTAQATDVTGNTGVVSAALPVTVDNVAPAAAVPVGITDDGGLRPLDRVTSDNTVAISGTAEAGATVEVFVDNVSVGTTTANGSGDWLFDHTATTLADGEHSVHARVTDIAGNSRIGTTPFTFTVDTDGPAAPVISSIANDTGRLGTDEITNDTTLTISGTTEPEATVTLIDTSNGNAVVGTVLADENGDWSVAISALTEGTHNLRAYATDVAGNDGAQTADFPVVVDLTPPTAPTISSFQSDTGISNTDGITNDGFGYLVSGTADPGSIVRVYLDGGLSGNPAWTALADSNGDWSWFYNGGIGSDGPMVFVATATDVAGNTSGFGSGYTVTFDYTAPAAAVITGVTEDRGASATDGITSDTSLTINGTSEAFAVITLSEGTLGALGSTQADSSGNWSYVVSSPFAEGDYSFTAAIQDRAGNAGSTSAAYEVTVDTTAPNTPAITGFSPDTAYIVPSGFPDLGTSFSDGVTKSSVIILTGTADAGAIITIYDGVTELGTALADGSGNWTYQTDPLPDGDHDFTATASDLAGNESGASGTTEVTTDTVNPLKPVITGVTSDTGRSSTDGITNDITFTIHGTGEAGTAIWLTSFQVPPGYNIIGGGAGTALVDVNGNWSIDLSALEVFTSTSPFHAPYVFTDGSYGFFAESLDVAGNGSGFGSTFTVTIDTTGPAAPVITSFGDDSGVQGDFITKDTTVTLNGTAEPNAIVTILDDVTTLGTALADGSGNWTFTTAALSDAAHSFTATATDTAGNTGTASAALVVTVDTTAPNAPLMNGSISDDTGIPADNITYDDTVTISGSAEADAVVSVYQDGVLIGTTTADGFGAWSFTTDELEDGDYDFTATQVDAAGNESVASVAVSVTVDTAAPGVPVFTGVTHDTGSSNSDEITNDNRLLLNGTAEAGSLLVITEAGTGFIGTALADSNGYWSLDYTGTALTDGGYAFQAYATDVAGNSSEPSALFVVNVDTSAPAAPVIASVATDTGSSSSDGITSDDTITLTGTAEAGSVITISDGGTDIGTTTVDGSGNWSFTTGDLADAAHSLTATATDAAGNESASSNTIAVTIDTAAPAAPTIDATISDDTGSSATDRITSDTTLTLTGDAEAGAIVTIIDGLTVLGTTQANGSGDWSFNSGVLGNFMHTFFATATDTAGNTSSLSSALFVDVDTTISTTSVQGITTDTGVSGTDEITSDTTLTINGMADHGTTVEVFRDGFRSAPPRRAAPSHGASPTARRSRMVPTATRPSQPTPRAMSAQRRMPLLSW